MSGSLNIYKPIKHILTIGIFAVLGFLIFKHQEEFYIIRDISAFQFIEISLLILIGVTLNGSKLNRIASNFGINLRTGEWLALSSMTTVLNSLFFKAGSVTISSYLKKKYGFPYLFFAGTFLGDQLIILFSGALVGSLISLYLGFSSHHKLLSISLGFALTAILLFYLMRGQIRLPQNKNHIFDRLRQGVESFNSLLRDKALLYFLSLHNIFLIITIGLRFYISCSILHLEIPLSHCFLFATAMIFARVLPVTHSDIGVREIIVGFLSTVLGNGLKAGILATMVDRIFELLWTVLCSAIFRNSLITPKD